MNDSSTGSYTTTLTSNFSGLADTPDTYIAAYGSSGMYPNGMWPTLSNYANNLLQVNGDGTGLSWVKDTCDPTHCRKAELFINLKTY
jgi:hypothetical protein